MVSTVSLNMHSSSYFIHCGATERVWRGLEHPKSKIEVLCNSSRPEDFFLRGWSGVGYLLGHSCNKHEQEREKAGI
jgi:hypothetical protein